MSPQRSVVAVARERTWPPFFAAQRREESSPAPARRRQALKAGWRSTSASRARASGERLFERVQVQRARLDAVVGREQRAEALAGNLELQPPMRGGPFEEHVATKPDRPRRFSGSWSTPLCRSISTATSGSAWFSTTSTCAPFLSRRSHRNRRRERRLGRQRRRLARAERFVGGYRDRGRRRRRGRRCGGGSGGGAAGGGTSDAPHGGGEEGEEANEGGAHGYLAPALFEEGPPEPAGWMSRISL